MVIDDRFQKVYDRLCGSRYSATMFLAREARNLCNQFQDVIDYSQALAWLLSGVVPIEVLHYKNVIKNRKYNALKYVEQSLSMVTDESVKQSVYKSLQRSKESGHLIYHYEGIYDRDVQARVRILTRKIWFESKELQM